MQPIRITTRLPHICRRASKSTSIPQTTKRTMSLFPHYAQNDFAPMFRLLDDWNSFSQQTRAGGSDLVTAAPRSFNPKFDIKESKDAYTLEGELPGIELDNVAVEWTDTATLSIKGRSEYRRDEGSRTAAADSQGRITAGGDTAAANANNTNGYHKPTVEDDNTNAMAVANSGAVATHEGGPQVKHARGGNSHGSGPRYWVTERSVGEFTRVFSFPHRVDQDKVKASLKNGILSVVVPKATAPEHRRVNVHIE